jgi:hypothetical protein
VVGPTGMLSTPHVDLSDRAGCSSVTARQRAPGARDAEVCSFLRKMRVPF